MGREEGKNEGKEGEREVEEGGRKGMKWVGGRMKREGKGGW